VPVDLPLYWITMARRLVAAIVPLLLGITPSLALACDARCLGEHAARAVAARAGHVHAGHPTSHQQAAAHAHDTDTARPSDAGSQGQVTTLVTGAAPMHHGCMAAFDEGTLDRHPVASRLGHATAGLVTPYPTLPSGPPAQPLQHPPPAARPVRAAIPLRI
jgi:hypothetical protein